MKKHAILVACTLLFACAGEKAKDESPSPVLEAVASDQTGETPLESPVPAAFETLKMKLAELGYEGVGLEHETIEVLERLSTVFGDPAAAGRRIKTIYTGATNDYDLSSETLTLSGTAETGELVGYLKKKVPMKGQNSVPAPAAPAKPKPKKKKK